MRLLNPISFTVFILALCLCSHHATAQQVSMDSVYKTICALPNDSIQLKKLLDFSDKVEVSDSMLCKEVYKNTLAISRKIGSPYYESKVFIYMGIFTKNHKDYATALGYLQQAYKIARSAGIDENVGSALANMGNIYHAENNIKEATTKGIEASYYLEKAGKTRLLSIILGNLCTDFENQRMYDKSIEYGLKAVQAAIQSKDKRAIGMAYGNLSVPYIRIRDKEKFYEAAKQELFYLREFRNPKHLHQAYQNIASYYIEVKDIPNATLYADSSLQMAEATNDAKFIAEAKILIGSIATEAKDFNKAGKILNETKAVTDKEGGMLLKGDWNSMMYRLENAKGNTNDSAVQYLKAQFIIEDSLKNVKILANTIALEKKFETEKKQLQITQLQKEKEIQQLSLHQKNIALYVLLGGLLAAFMVGFLLYKNNKRRHQVATQKEALHQQQIKELEKEKQLLAVSGMLQSQEAERSRMAKDLHDGLGGMLSGIKLNLSSMKGNMIVHENDAALFNKSLGQLDNAIAEMRRVAHNMMPEALLKFGIIEAVQDYCDGINESRMVNMQFTHLGFDKPLEKSIEVVLYRIVQELSNNAIKHAAATHIFIQITQHERGLTLTVEDDGKGFDVAQITKGAGLQNVQSRVDYLNGSMEISSTSGVGSTFNLEIPL